ncbi:MAG TPA: hypothetical protein VHZ07_03715 [Bryobacteraceae bacterium]|nr:hypothetical protein [Bryobacteraceae bacterium]
MDLSRGVYSRDLKITVMRALDAGQEPLLCVPSASVPIYRERSPGGFDERQFFRMRIASFHARTARRSVFGQSDALR